MGEGGSEREEGVHVQRGGIRKTNGGGGEKETWEEKGEGKEKRMRKGRRKQGVKKIGEVMYEKKIGEVMYARGKRGVLHVD